MKIAIVVQRYGDQIVGGAEAHARDIAEALVHRLGWQVDVLTTCASDYMTWKNEYEEKPFTLNGVRVLRFRSLLGRSKFFGIYNKIAIKLLGKMRGIPSLSSFVRFSEWLWIILQGPVNLRMAKYIREHQDDYHKFFFFTYLYLPTVWGIHIAKEKSVLIPTAHDEPPFYFDIYKNMLENTPTILANAPSEKRLLATRVTNSRKIHIAGLGLQEPTTGQAYKHQVPYVLYLGRVSKGKNVHVLIDYFLNWQSKTGVDCQLILAGKLDTGFEGPKNPRVRYVGFVNNHKKQALILGSSCLINPSPLESLSLIVLEGIMHERPVIVNKHCPVLKDYTDACKTVLGYNDEEEFGKCLNKIFNQEWKKKALHGDLAEAKAWAQKNYSWDKVLREYERSVGGKQSHA